MNQYEYNFYFGTLIREVGYKPNQRISMKEILEIIQKEELNNYSNIAFYPANIYQGNMVAIIKDQHNFSIIKTGEKGSGFGIKFNDEGTALNYMLALLRLKKQEAETITRRNGR